MEMKQTLTFFHGTYLNLTSYKFLSKILKYFNDFQNQNFPVLRLTGNQTIEMKQNQKFFSWDIFKSDIMFHWTQNTKNISMTFKI